jgi:hypothetical protein
MDTFDLDDPPTGQRFECTIYDVAAADDPLDEYREITLKTADDRIHRTSFWRDPLNRGAYWCEEPGMVILPDLDKENVTAAINGLLRDGELMGIFSSEP